MILMISHQNSLCDGQAADSLAGELKTVTEENQVLQRELKLSRQLERQYASRSALQARCMTHIDLVVAVDRVTIMRFASTPVTSIAFQTSSLVCMQPTS
jgi:hypothetical protein